jgi:3-hydroxyisobutyryl-CoA hydrolase
MHGPFRVVTENAVFAMPEVFIGMFPDVGGSFFLSRLDGELGTYLGLTGQRLHGSDIVSARLATHFVPSERLNTLTERLCELEVSDWSVVNATIEEFATVPSHPMKLNQYRGIIDECFQYNTIEEIMHALKGNGSEFALTTLKTLEDSSPSSLYAALDQIRKGKTMDIASAFKFEWNLVNNMIVCGGFRYQSLFIY